MKTEKLIEQKQDERLSILKTVNQGTTIRFPHDSFESAMDENLFYIVCQNTNKRVKLVCMANAEIIERDEEWRVVQHESKLLVKPSV